MSIAGIILAVLALLAAVPAGLVFGWLGGGIAAGLALIGIILGAAARAKKKKGLPAIIIGVIALVLAVLMALLGVEMAKTLRDKATEYGAAYAREYEKESLMAKYADSMNPNLGVYGFLASMLADAGEAEDTDALTRQLSEEVDFFNKLSEDATLAAMDLPDASAAIAPEEEAAPLEDASTAGSDTGDDD